VESQWAPFKNIPNSCDQQRCQNILGSKPICHEKAWNTTANPKVSIKKIKFGCKMVPPPPTCLRHCLWFSRSWFMVDEIQIRFARTNHQLTSVDARLDDFTVSLQSLCTNHHPASDANNLFNWSTFVKCLLVYGSLGMQFSDIINTVQLKMTFWVHFMWSPPPIY